jgi:ABC-2 type transport system permease protein
MPIFDQGYQHWDGQLSGHAWRWFAIARRGVRTQLKNRWTRMALLFAWLPALAIGVFLALWGLLEQKADDWAAFFPFLPMAVLQSPKDFRGEVWSLVFSSFLWVETFAAMVLVVIIGPNLISQDLRFNAMPLYLSRPLTRIDYFAGKLATIAAFLFAVILVPAVLTYLLGIGFSLDFRVIGGTFRIVPACIAYGVVVVTVAGLFMLAISSLSKNSRYVAALWIGIWLVGGFASGILGDPHVLGFKWGPIVSITNNLSRVREVLLGTKESYEKIRDAGQQAIPGFVRPVDPPPVPTFFAQDYPWQWSAYVLLGLVVLSLWILTTRVKSLDRLR